MRTKVVHIYKYEELDDSAKENARDWYRSGGDCDCYCWDAENLDSLRAWAEWFHVKIRDYSFGGSDNRSQGVKFEVNIDSNVEDLRGVRLWKWLNNQFILPKLDGNCPFTGYGFDETLLDPIREFMKRPSDLTYFELMKECIDAFCLAYADDVDYSYSDEAVEENIIINEYEFDSQGRREW